RNWDPEVLSFEVESSDANLVNSSVRLVHHEIGRQSISAVVDWKFDTDDKTRVSYRSLIWDEYNIFNRLQTLLKAYWSRTGRETDYHELPYNIPNIKFTEFINEYYMKLVYPEVANCSNMPPIEKFVPPWKRGTYIFNECGYSGDTAPEILPRGYYKMVIKIIGQAEVVYTATAKLKPKHM
ncbi:hypothetical protein KR044_009117, partial [Drosophila immigrans]